MAETQPIFVEFINSAGHRSLVNLTQIASVQERPDGRSMINFATTAVTEKYRHKTLMLPFDSVAATLAEAGAQLTRGSATPQRQLQLIPPSATAAWQATTPGIVKRVAAITSVEAALNDAWTRVNYNAPQGNTPFTNFQGSFAAVARDLARQGAVIHRATSEPSTAAARPPAVSVSTLKSLTPSSQAA